MEVQRPAKMFKIENRAYKMSMLAMAIRHHSNEIPVKKIKTNTHVELEPDTSYVCTAGMFTHSESILRVKAVWRPITISIKGRDKETIHRSFNDGQVGTIRTDGHTLFRISTFEKYHGPTMWLEDVPKLIIKFGVSWDLVGYRPKGMPKEKVNVALVCEAEWFCINCKGRFKTEHDWAKHTKPHVTLPYKTGWHRLSICDDQVCFSPNEFVPGIRRVFEKHDDYSLMDERRYGTPEKWWAMMIRALEKKAEKNPGRYSAMHKHWSKRTHTDFNRLIFDMVDQSRAQWSSDGMQNLQTQWCKKRNTWIPLSRDELSTRHAYRNAIRRFDDEYARRKSKREILVRIPETRRKMKIYGPFGPDTTVKDFQIAIKKQKCRPIPKQHIYLGGRVVASTHADSKRFVQPKEPGYLQTFATKKARLEDYGVEDETDELEIEMGDQNARWETKPRAPPEIWVATQKNEGWLPTSSRFLSKKEAEDYLAHASGGEGTIARVK